MQQDNLDRVPVLKSKTAPGETSLVKNLLWSDAL